MHLEAIDFLIIGLFFLITLLIGLWASKQAGQNFTEYFLAGGNMPWWLLGISMVATTFAADTPNLVTEIVRKDGIAGNWVWWAFLLSGMLTVFVYAKLWKRSGVLTDLEFYEVRYSGKPAAFLRAFRAIFLGIIFNCVIMANVILAGIKIANILLGINPETTIMAIAVVTVLYTMLGGLKGVIFTDFFQFVISLIGVIGAAVVVVNLPQVGSLKGLVTHPEIASKIEFFPNFNLPVSTYISAFLIPIAIQWWANWYPGAEPGGGGYIAQRMLSAKSESDATGATLLFNIAHYALRPWPWIIVALASMIVFPTLDSIQQAFPDLDPSLIKDDLAYPAMLTFLPAGLLGLVIASLTAALMSTISTHLNWGSSYITYDFYKRFINQDASDKQLVRVGRITTIALMVVASLLALQLKSALGAFNILLQIGAGTGLIYLLRWFWWRVNAFSEIAGMVSSLSLAIYFEIIMPAMNMTAPDFSVKLISGVVITSFVWLIVTLLTRPTASEKLEEFYQKVRPDGPGWKPTQAALKNKGIEVKQDHTLGAGILAMMLATLLVYAILFSTGWYLTGNTSKSLIGVVVAMACAFGLRKIWPKLKMS